MRLILLLLGAASLARGGTRFSQDYSISADDLNAAGGPVLAANYTIHDSLNETGGNSFAAGLLIRQGYPGQIFDPAVLNVSAAPAVFGETSTCLLSAHAVNDDGTGDPVPSPAVGWSVVSGPVNSISGSGFCFPAPVLTDSPAVVKGSWSGISGTANLTVLDTNPDNFGIYAGDGIPDSWQAGLFGPDNPEGRAAADPDGDGFDNLFEYLAGLNPMDYTSTFSLWTYLSSPQRRNIEFGPLMPGRKYDLEASTDLAKWELVPGAVVIRDDGRWRTVQDGQAVEPRKFYRIRISIP